MRCFLPSEAWSGNRVVLDASESRHAVRVLRKRAGDALTVFDGQGRHAEARVVRAESSGVELELGDVHHAAPPATRMTLYLATLKEAHLDWALQKSTELGVTRICPVETAHTVVRLSAAQRPRKRERWERVVLAAAKQSGNPWLPEVEEARSFEACLEEGRALDLQVYAALIAERRPLRSVLDQPPPAALGIWIGPEGDFSPDEDRALRASGAAPVDLGPRVLRSDTAAVYVLSVVQNAWEGSADRGWTMKDSG